MKIKVGIFIVLLIVLDGCASQGWRTHDIPYPAGTPFDANQFARQAYLDGFRSGYIAQQQQKGTELISGPFGRARELGFRAGAAEARAQMEGATAPSAPMR
jgi:hypothetical protein